MSRANIVNFNDHQKNSDNTGYKSSEELAEAIQELIQRLRDGQPIKHNL